MCGFSGFLLSKSKSLVCSPYSFSLEQMSNAIIHRGPDTNDVWFDANSGVGLAHVRLSILELSKAGAQPMHSANNRFVISFNGEIYNHLVLRTQLDNELGNITWRGSSDTETLLECIAAWGLKRTLQAAVGMFAFALWDTQENELVLARDRLGEKPLYWGWAGDTLLFGSELKALKAHPEFSAQINRDALALFLRYNYIPAPYSIYQGIEKLLPGHYVQIKEGQKRVDVTPKAYWSFNDAVEAGVSNPFTGSDSEAVDLLEAKIKQSLIGQMEADVPVGAFLSGGVDSSVVAALMQAQSDKPIKTFAIGFDEPGYNEAEYAKAVAEHLGTDHTELYITAQDALDVIPQLAKIYCEPFADSSQIPTFLASRLAQQHVTVALSGDAGDELFGGYNTYQFVPKIWKKLEKIPLPLRSISGYLLSKLPLPEKVAKLVDVLSAKDQADFYSLLVSHWKNAEDLVIGANKVPTLLSEPTKWPKVDTLEEWMMAIDAQQYMVDDVLVKVDRAAMANSLEVRVPMLDHRVVEFAWQLPLGMKIRNGTGKWALREVLYRYVPRELIERPKKGFSIPLGEWLRGPLKEWAEPLLSEQRLQEEGYFKPKEIRKVWNEHLQEQTNHSGKLWSILMFQSWLDQNK